MKNNIKPIIALRIIFLLLRVAISFDLINRSIGLVFITFMLAVKLAIITITKIANKLITLDCNPGLRLTIKRLSYPGLKIK